MSEHLPSAAAKTWQFRLLLSISIRYSFADKSMALKADSKFCEGGTEVDGVRILLRRAQNRDQSIPAEGNQPRGEAVYLFFKVDGATREVANRRVLPIIDLVIDDLSYQLQEPLRTYEMEVVDCTPPATLGSDREFWRYTGFDQFKLSRSHAALPADVEPHASLRDDYPDIPERVRDSLDWYIKALHAHFDADKFILLWISFEILVQQLGNPIEESRKLRCGHTVTLCPECGTATAQYLQGATVRAFLARFNIDVQTVKDLWQMRQLVHGVANFDEEMTNRLSRLVHILQSITVCALNIGMGAQVDARPRYPLDGPALTDVIGLGGRRPLTEEDVW